MRSTTCRRHRPPRARWCRDGRRRFSEPRFSGRSARSYSRPPVEAARARSGSRRQRRRRERCVAPRQSPSRTHPTATGASWVRGPRAGLGGAVTRTRGSTRGRGVSPSVRASARIERRREPAACKAPPRKMPWHLRVVGFLLRSSFALPGKDWLPMVVLGRVGAALDQRYLPVRRGACIMMRGRDRFIRSTAPTIGCDAGVRLRTRGTA